MNNFDWINLEDLYLTESNLMRMETDKGYVKHYKRENGAWNLTAVEDADGIIELTSIPDYKTTYADLENGRIWNDLRNDFSKANTPNYYGYIYSSFEGSPVALHVLLMSAYTQMKPTEWRKQKLEIDHINGDKTDNRCGEDGNLRLVTRAEQYDERVRATMGQGTPLTQDEVQYIRYLVAMLEAKGEKVDSIIIHMIAKKYSRKYETIRKLLLGHTHRNIELTSEMKAQVTQARLEHDLERVKELVV